MQNPMAVVTIDFWNTLFDSSGGVVRNDARRAVLMAAAADAGYNASFEQLEEAYRSIWAYFDVQWLEHHRTPTSPELVREICQRANIQLREEVLDAVAREFSRGVLQHPPVLLPGAAEALAQLASRARLALISDTAFSPGSVLRELMELNNVAQYFDAFIFSDETGVAKPHPDAFRLALEALGGTAASAVHIGDLERTDIAGAKGAGMKAILYRGVESPHKYAEDATTADAVMHHWNEVLDMLAMLGLLS
ncbi:MAG TPA: HAD family hydrolase [Candidatus Kapabacteria bacterium]|nr:HAD family hydrolase [Candidatus Kapabacteria bacterium]